MSATADRSARAIQRSLFMASMLVQGFSAGIRARGREKARELREKPLVWAVRHEEAAPLSGRCRSPGHSFGRRAACNRSPDGVERPQ